MADGIIEELWRIKDGIAREYNCDVDAFLAHLNACPSLPGEYFVDLRGTGRAEQGAPPDSGQRAILPE
jgi:hypothetical protein